MHEEDDSSREAREKAIFYDLTSEFRDAGIESFQSRFEFACDKLTEKYAHKEDIDGASEEIEELSDQFNDEWPHYGAAAVVSGRVRMYDSDYRAAFPSEWEEECDEDGQEDCFYIRNETLYSQGVAISPVWEADGKMIASFRPTYRFSTDSDVDNYYEDDFLLYSYFSDLRSQEYEDPTIEEVECRLEKQWPEVYEVLCDYIHKNLQRHLPSRLTILIERIQSQLSESRELVTYVERFINSRLALDSQQPYAFSITKQFDLWMDGEEGDVNDPSSWTTCTTDDDIPVLGFDPRVMLARDKKDVVRPTLVTAVYNSDDDEPEYIRVGTSNIEDFVSTRMAHAIGALALWPSTMATVGATKASLVATEKGRFPITPEQEEESCNGDEVYAPYEEIDAILQDMAVEAAELSQEIYVDRDAAIAAATVLRVKVLEMLQPHISLLPRLDVDVSGDVSFPVANSAVSRTSEGITYSMDVNYAAMQQLENGDTLQGSFVGVTASAKSWGSDNEPIGYIPCVNLLVSLDGASRNRALFASDGTPLASLSESVFFVLPLNGEAEVSIPSLERHRRAKQEIVRATNYYGKTADVVKHVKSLATILTARMKDSAMAPLRDPTIFSTISEDVDHIREEGLSSLEAVRAIDALLVKRRGAIEGFSLLENDEKTVNSGIIIDIREDMTADDIVMVVSSEEDNEVRYFPFKRIARFLY